MCSEAYAKIFVDVNAVTADTYSDNILMNLSSTKFDMHLKNQFDQKIVLKRVFFGEVVLEWTLPRSHR